MNPFLIEDGILRRYDGNMVDVVIPDQVQTIGAWVFWSDGKMKSVVIPDHVTGIAYGAFYGCGQLTEVFIPAKVRSIGGEAFAYCSKLKRIEIAAADCSIKASAFKDCRDDADFIAPIALLKGAQQKRKVALTYLRHPEFFTDPKNVAEIKKYLLSQKKALLPYIFREDMVNAVSFLAENGKINKNNVNEEFLDPANRAGAYQCVAFLLEWKNRNISFEDEEMLLEKELSKDLYNAADMKKLWSYTVLEDKTLCLTGYKGDDVEIYVPERIGRRAVSRIGESCFSPAGEYVSETAKKILSNIEKVYIPEGVRAIDDRAFFRCEKLMEIDIPETVSFIGVDAFRNCRLLKDVKGLENVKIIGEGAFRSCSALEKVKFSEYLTEIKSWTFSSCNELQSPVLPERLKELGQHAFSWTKCTEIDIPVSVDSIGSGAFAYCKELKEVQLPEGLNGLEAYAFRGCTALESIRIPSRVKSLADGLFENCESLENVMIDEGIATIGRGAFSGCSKLKTVVIPDSVVTIDCDAFSRSGLERVVVPENVSELGRLAFSSCSSLERAEICGAIITLAYGMFMNCPRLKEVFIPADLIDIDPEAFSGSPQAVIIKR